MNPRWLVSPEGRSISFTVFCNLTVQTLVAFIADTKTRAGQWSEMLEALGKSDLVIKSLNL